MIRHVRYTYARCEQSVEPSPDKPNVVTAPKPIEGLPRCIADASLLAQIMAGKFTYHLPLYRLEKMLRDSGVKIARRACAGGRRAWPRCAHR